MNKRNIRQTKRYTKRNKTRTKKTRTKKTRTKKTTHKITKNEFNMIIRYRIILKIPACRNRTSDNPITLRNHYSRMLYQLS